MSTELAGELKGATGVFFASYQGLKFKEIAVLRGKLSPTHTTFRVVRNSVAAFALKDAGIDGKAELSEMKGPTAIAIQQTGDIVESAKVLVAFEKEFPALKLRSCYSSQSWFNVNECRQLSKLPTRIELVGHLAGTLYSSVSQIAGVLQAPIRDFAYVLQAVHDKKKGEAAA